MLSEKPWKPDALIRLLLGVFICLCLGSVAVSALHYAGPGGKERVLFLCTSTAAMVLLAAAVAIASQQWKVETVMRPILLMLGCLSAGLAFAAWSQKMAGRSPEASSGEQMVIAEGAVLFFFIAFMRAHRIGWAEAFGMANRWKRAVLYGAIVACFFLPIGDRLQWASAQLMTHLRLHVQEQQAVHALRETNTWPNRLVLGVLAIGLAPIVEEIFFRGMLYAAIKQAGFPRLALWGVSLLFACVHFNLVTFIPLLVLALLLTFLYERTDNLLAPITAHALFNALNFTVLYLFERQLAS
jgi:membrane protease YdiL (CAAX protease family)